MRINVLVSLPRCRGARRDRGMKNGSSAIAIACIAAFASLHHVEAASQSKPAWNVLLIYSNGRLLPANHRGGSRSSGGDRRSWSTGRRSLHRVPRRPRVRRRGLRSACCPILQREVRRTPAARHHRRGYARSAIRAAASKRTVCGRSRRSCWCRSRRSRLAFRRGRDRRSGRIRRKGHRPVRAPAASRSAHAGADHRNQLVRSHARSRASGGRRGVAAGAVGGVPVGTAERRPHAAPQGAACARHRGDAGLLRSSRRMARRAGSLHAVSRPPETPAA